MGADDAQKPPAPGWWQDEAGGWHPPPGQVGPAAMNTAGGNQGDRNLKGLVVAIALVVIAVIYFNSRDSDEDTRTTRTFVPPAGPVEIRYELGGSASSADITMETPGGTSQQQGVDVPLRTKTGLNGLRVQFQPGDFVYVSAQNNGSGSITCRIVGSDGTVIATNTSSGEYAIATCDGRAR